MFYFNKLLINLSKIIIYKYFLNIIYNNFTELLILLLISNSYRNYI